MNNHFYVTLPSDSSATNIVRITRSLVSSPNCPNEVVLRGIRNGFGRNHLPAQFADEALDRQCSQAIDDVRCSYGGTISRFSMLVHSETGDVFQISDCLQCYMGFELQPFMGEGSFGTVAQDIRC
jgi:hypothetical protein